MRSLQALGYGGIRVYAGGTQEWEDRGGVSRAVGQRVLFVDTGSGGESDDRAILAIRELELGG